MSEIINNTVFFDPFAENGQEMFDPVASHEAITARYLDNEVEHDYTADRYVSDTQALMLDAQFVGKFAEAQAIAMRMHQMCGEDHGLQQSLNANETFSQTLSSMVGEHAGHNHSDRHDKHNHRDTDEIDPKTGKKKKTTGKSEKFDLRSIWLGKSSIKLALAA